MQTPFFMPCYILSAFECMLKEKDFSVLFLSVCRFYFEHFNDDESGIAIKSALKPFSKTQADCKRRAPKSRIYMGMPIRRSKKQFSIPSSCDIALI